jgi:methionine synthase I (cobalamin-dependent)/5,10-methylenetetrahydrofolate reductase
VSKAPVPRPERFRDMALNGRAHLFDGGFGTELYKRGVSVTRCFDELNLSRPEMVTKVHQDFRKAGAEILETNTYGANRLKLTPFGFQEKVGEITRVAARLAREAAGDGGLVAGAIGPLGVRIEPFGPLALAEARELFREQAEGLQEGGADLIILETFGYTDEIIQAIRGVKEVSDLPVVAQMTVGSDLLTPFGTDPEHFVPRLEDEGVDVLGVNCSVGPNSILQAIERIRPLTSLPLCAQPNGGLPREVEGRKMYVASPEYMADYAKRLVLAGARFVGGCCGTGPEHIQRMAEAIRPLQAPSVVIQAREREGTKEAAAPVVPLADRSRLGSKLAQGLPITTVEIVPPRGVDPSEMLEKVAILKGAGVDAVNVPDGPRAQMKMGALATSILIQQQVGLEALVHYTCRDRNLLGMLSDLLGAHAVGLRNLLIITGDPPRMGPYPDATAVFDVDSVGLTHLVSSLNKGLDPGGNSIGTPASFVIGVGVNPGAPDLEQELQHFYWKVDAGADFAITQPVFDVGQMEAFLAELDRRDLRIPILAGIWPLVSLRNAEFLANEVPGIQVPESTMTRMRGASERGKEAAVQEGVTIAREIRDALAEEVQGIQVSAPFGRVELALQVIRDLPGHDPMDMPMMRPQPARRGPTGEREG